MPALFLFPPAFCPQNFPPRSEPKSSWPAPIDDCPGAFRAFSFHHSPFRPKHQTNRHGPGKPHLMGNPQHAQAFDLQLLQGFPHLPGALRVQSACTFIPQEHGRFCAHGADNAHLKARKLLRSLGILENLRSAPFRIGAPMKSFPLLGQGHRRKKKAGKLPPKQAHSGAVLCRRWRARAMTIRCTSLVPS
jgi:hypothetical protein